MTAKKTTIMVAMILAGGIVGAALAQTSQQGPGDMPMGQMNPRAMQKMMGEMMPSPNDPPSTKDLKAADMQMMWNMHVPYAGNRYVDFRTHMIPHHQGAEGIQLRL